MGNNEATVSDKSSCLSPVTRYKTKLTLIYRVKILRFFMCSCSIIYNEHSERITPI